MSECVLLTCAQPCQGLQYGTGSPSEAQGVIKAFLWSKYNGPVCAKASNCSFLVPDVYNLRPLPSRDLLLRLANLSSHAVQNKRSELPGAIHHSS